MNPKKKEPYFSTLERVLWCGSVALIVLSFALFDRENWLTLAASLVGVTSLLFSAKGNPIGQALMIGFSLLYGIISYSFSYYGEMATYLGMTLPMAVCALVSWLKHPSEGEKAEVQVNQIHRQETTLMCLAAAAVTAGFSVLLAHFHTANLLPSTLSVTTSFLAVYLTFRRSPYFALAYAANDLILILLWGLASREDIRYLSVVVCFCAFLVNDLYGFWSWQVRARRQRAAEPLFPKAEPLPLRD